jgi:hypothetical protein
VFMKKSPAATYNDIDRKKVDFEYLRNKLKLKQFEAKGDFTKKFPGASSYLKKKGLDLSKLREHSAKILSTGALTGSLMLSSPANINTIPAAAEMLDKVRFTGGNIAIGSLQKIVIDGIAAILPKSPRPLTPSEEKSLERLFAETMRINTDANLEGEHLNTNYGYIGAEQHLRRYPGDILANHGEGDVLAEGMAPGLGAWGYFASSKEAMNKNLEETEKWYAVVQTLYLPDWNRRHAYLVDWYKYRKVLIVNTLNGNAVVAAISDSGPAAWTGKQYGGSPEVMQYLGGKRYKKGTVLVFFVDDPENKVPLGPVEYNKTTLPEGVVLRS